MKNDKIDIIEKKFGKDLGEGNFNIDYIKNNNKTMKILYEIKYAFQRLFRGYDDRKSYDVYYEIAKFTLRHLKNFRKLKKVGYPRGLTMRKWNKILDKMIYAFERLANDDILVYQDKNGKSKIRNTKNIKKINSKIDEGLALFVKYFQSLWD
jgi:hypothetical protein